MKPSDRIKEIFAIRYFRWWHCLFGTDKKLDAIIDYLDEQAEETKHT